MAYIQFGARIFWTEGDSRADQSDAIDRIRLSGGVSIYNTFVPAPARGEAQFDNSDDRFTPRGGSLMFTAAELAAPHRVELFRRNDGAISWEGFIEDIRTDGQRRGIGARSRFLLEGLFARNWGVSFEYKKPYNTPVVEWFEALAAALGRSVDYARSVLPPQELVGLIEWDLDPRQPVSLALQETAVWSGQLVGETKRGLLATAHPNATGRPVKVFDNQSMPIEDIHIEEAIGQVRNRIYAKGWEVLSDTIRRAGPAIPSGLEIIGVTHNSLRMSWQPVSGADWYEVGISEAGSSTVFFLARVDGEASYIFDQLANGEPLRPGTNYVLAVRAVNAYGTSDWNHLVETTSVAMVPDPELARTPGNVPEPIVVESYVDGVATIVWQPAENATRYDYQARSDRHRVAPMITEGLRGTLRLNAGEEYLIEVRGRADAGSSPDWTELVYVVPEPEEDAPDVPSGYVLPVGEPQDVDLFRVAGPPEQLRVTWGPGENATGYEVRMRTGGGAWSAAVSVGDVRGYTFPGVTPAANTRYRAQVRSLNPELGESGWVEDELQTGAADGMTGQVRVAERLATPAVTIATRTTERLVFSGSAVANASHYTWQWRRGLRGDWVAGGVGSSRTFEIPSPEVGVTYYIRVLAQNPPTYTESHYGHGQGSLMQPPAPTILAPRTPLVTTTMSDVTGRVVWSVLTSTTQPVDWCRMRVLDGTEVVFTSPRLGGSRRSATALGLKPGTAYTCEVEVGNAAGSTKGTATGTTVAARATAPTAAPTVAVSSSVLPGVGGHRIVWTWGAVAGADTYDTRLDRGYVLNRRTFWREGAWVSRGADLSYTAPFPALYGTAWRLAVRARNSIRPFVGPSDSEAITIPTPTRLATPAVTVGDPGYRSIQLSVTSSVTGATAYMARRTSAFSNPITQEQIWSRWVPFSDALQRRHFFLNLAPATTYTIEVIAIDGADRNRDSLPWSRSVRTDALPVLTPIRLRVTKTLTSLTLHWELPSTAQHDTLQVSLDGTTVAGVTLSRGVRQYEFSGLSQNTSYRLGVRLNNGRWAYITERTLRRGL